MPHETARKRSCHCCALSLFRQVLIFVQCRLGRERFGGPNRLSKVGGDCSGKFSVPWPKLPETLVPESSIWKNVMLKCDAPDCRRATGNRKLFRAKSRHGGSV